MFPACFTIYYSVLTYLFFLPFAGQSLYRSCSSYVCEVPVGSHDAVNRSEWYSFNPISSVTTLGTSGSETASTLGGLDQSCADFVLMASPIRGQSLHPLQRGVSRCMHWTGLCGWVQSLGKSLCYLCHVQCNPLHAALFFACMQQTCLQACLACVKQQTVYGLSLHFSMFCM